MNRLTDSMTSLFHACGGRISSSQILLRRIHTQLLEAAGALGDLEGHRHYDPMTTLFLRRDWIHELRVRVMEYMVEIYNEDNTTSTPDLLIWRRLPSYQIFRWGFPRIHANMGSIPEILRMYIEVVRRDLSDSECGGKITISIR